jgi:hypothetical protein
VESETTDVLDVEETVDTTVVDARVDGRPEVVVEAAEVVVARKVVVASEAVNDTDVPDREPLPHATMPSVATITATTHVDLPGYVRSMVSCPIFGNGSLRPPGV